MDFVPEIIKKSLSDFKKIFNSIFWDQINIKGTSYSTNLTPLVLDNKYNCLQSQMVLNQTLKNNKDDKNNLFFKIDDLRIHTSNNRGLIAVYFYIGKSIKERISYNTLDCFYKGLYDNNIFEMKNVSIDISFTPISYLNIIVLETDIFGNPLEGDNNLKYGAANTGLISKNI